MKDYIIGPLSNPTNEVLHQGRSVLVNNMDSERMADYQYQIKKSHNATTGFRDGKAKYVYNGCAKWIDGLEPSEQRRAILFAIEEGAKQRKQASEAKHILQVNISLRRERMKTERHEERKKEKEREVKAVPNDE